MSSTTGRACPICGKTESLKHCASCKRVSYCSREHQRQHWKVHRAECTHRPKQSSDKSSPSAIDNNMVVVVEIKSGQGDGLANPMVKHLFDSLIEAKSYIQERLGYARLEDMKEFTEMPFLTEFMKFSSPDFFLVRGGEQ
ncbi:hypothetical protein PF010_g13724 [Phytophthora fragariae]|uniref:MYND-type domain-containing protein n=1 Tax=Phytophthora fragariae TaxID=53985 RepID=A0A6G0KYZ4_9STRA|nr:hypothetical protein PF010_g13724 [Phytophthora fragariae]